MGKCILRVAKITSQGSATGKTTHNDRLAVVPNADPERQHMNQEYINEEKKNIWTLANERIEQVGIKSVRKDAVRGMEFVITASPDTFGRDSAGLVKGDCRNSGWVQDNIDFLAQKYGGNLVALTLHQDEKTPHIHAIVVPITADGRLSAKDLFNPVSLKKLQTEYAQAMSKYGLERGIEGSRARHQTMKQIYGAQQQTKQGIESDLQPLHDTQEPLTIEKPGTFDLLNLERWRQQQEARINAEYNRRLDEVREAAQKAQNIAVANATAAEQVKVLKQQLNTSEELKQAHFEKATQLSSKLENVTNRYDALTVLADEKCYNPAKINKRANEIRARVTPKIENAFLATLREMAHPDEFTTLLEQKGYKVEVDKEDVIYGFRDPKTAVKIPTSGYHIGGQLIGELYDNRVAQLAQAEEQRVKAAAAKAREAAAPKQAAQQTTPGQKGKEVQLTQHTTPPAAAPKPEEAKKVARPKPKEEPQQQQPRRGRRP